MENLEETDEFLDINDLLELSQDKQCIMAHKPHEIKAIKSPNNNKKVQGARWIHRRIIPVPQIRIKTNILQNIPQNRN